MGVCAACFTRDTAGALGLHRAEAVQYVRPEILGVVLGALVASLASREFRPRTGSSPVVRFLLGMFAMTGALVFLGCPWRGVLRLGAGDLNAAVGMAGLVAGVVAGVFFLRRGFGLGRSREASPAVGWILPALCAALLLLLALDARLGPAGPGGARAGPLFSSSKGPGSQHAPLLLSLGAGLAVGFLFQRSRLCTVGAFRNLLLARDAGLLRGIVAMFLAATAANLVLQQARPEGTFYRLGFEGQPIAHSSHLWNFLGMALAGTAFTLGGGCPGRQTVLAGEGDGDAGVFVLGMVAGAAFSHNFALASGPGGPSEAGPFAVVAGLAVCAILGFSMKEPRAA
jgi:YedE family putative selenium metabolism protein